MMKIAMPKTGRRAHGIDHAKLRRWEADLSMKSAALQGALVQLRGNADHAGMKGELEQRRMLLWQGIDPRGRALLDQQPSFGAGLTHFVELERVDAETRKTAAPTNHIAQLRVDMSDVHYCIALQQDIAALQERADLLSVEIGPLRKLVAACRAYVEEQS